MLREAGTRFARRLVLWSGLAACLCYSTASFGSTQEAMPAVSDTGGVAQLQWVYDSWTVPWVQVRGAAAALAPASHATLMTLACETANLEHDRGARHLSAEECEHRMAAIRADQDTALIFRLALRAFDSRGLDPLVRLGPAVSFQLEDDRGRQWVPIQVQRGPAVQVATGQKLSRIYYYPPWVRGSERGYANRYDVSEGSTQTVAEHRLRFARRDSLTQELVITPETRWVRLRISYSGYEWVATWTFRSDATIDR